MLRSKHCARACSRWTIQNIHGSLSIRLITITITIIISAQAVQVRSVLIAKLPCAVSCPSLNSTVTDLTDFSNSSVLALVPSHLHQYATSCFVQRPSHYQCRDLLLLTYPCSHTLLWCSALGTGTGTGRRTLRWMVPN